MTKLPGSSGTVYSNMLSCIALEPPSILSSAVLIHLSRPALRSPVPASGARRERLCNKNLLGHEVDVDIDLVCIRVVLLQWIGTEGGLNLSYPVSGGVKCLTLK